MQGPEQGDMDESAPEMALMEETERLTSLVNVEDKGYTSMVPVTHELPRCQSDFNSKYQYIKPHSPDVSERLRASSAECSAISTLCQLFPILVWLRNYRWHQDFLWDVVSGFTVGIMHLPQGMAYAMLAGVPPITGLYMAFFPVLVYVLMATSRHVSMGTFSVVCIMTSSAVLTYAPNTSDMAGKLDTNSSTILGEEESSSSLADLEALTPVQVAAAVALVVGLWQVLLGMMKMGVLGVLLSETLVSGFTTAAAVHVLVSQIKNLTGIKVASHNENFKVFFVFKDLVVNYETANVMALVISFTTIVLLVIYTQFLKPRIEKKLPVPVPIELITIVMGTLLSRYFEFSSNYSLKTVGDIPTGLPAPSVPPMFLLPKLVFHGLVIAIVAFSVNLSMASILAKKKGYEIDANQELLASGVGNVFGSFFSCAPFAASLSRSMIQQTVGGRTQLASFVSCSLLLLVLLVLGPFFEPLPNCILASIVVVALKSMFLQVLDLPKAWRKSKMDGLVWIVTFLSAISFDIDIGLGIGVFLSMLSLQLLGHRLNIIILGNVRGTDLYLDICRYKSAQEIPGICIIQPAGGMHFANCQYFMRKCQKLTGLLGSSTKASECRNDAGKLICVIIDMICTCFVDPSASLALTSLFKELHTKAIKLYIVNIPPQVLERLHHFDFFDEFPEAQVYHSINDAVSQARQNDFVVECPSV